MLAEVPPNLGCSQDSWRFNDSRATPGGQIVAGRMNQVISPASSPQPAFPQLHLCDFEYSQPQSASLPHKCTLAEIAEPSHALALVGIVAV